MIPQPGTTIEVLFWGYKWIPCIVLSDEEKPYSEKLIVTLKAEEENVTWRYTK